MQTNGKIEYIDINKILFDNMAGNGGIISSTIILCLAYWIQDVIFFGSFGKFSSNVPEFMKNANIDKIFSLIFPYLLAEILFYINNIIVSHTIPQIELNIVEELSKQTLKSIQTSKHTINTNEYILNLKKVLESKTVYFLFVSNVVPTVLAIFGMLYYFSKGGLQIGFVSLFIICVFLYVVIIMCRENINASRKNEDTINTMYDNIQDIMINYDLVITSNTIDTELKNINIDKKNVYDTYLSSEISSSESSFYLRIFSLIVIIVLDVYSMYLYYNKKINIELVVSICTLSVIVLKYFNNMISRFRNSVGYIGKFYEIENYFKQFKIILDVDEKPDILITKANIRFENINLRLKNKIIFSNFNFEIKPNTKVGILGDMGMGKTTILKMLCGLVNYEGNIFIDNQDIQTKNHKSIINNIAYISQQPKMFNKNILYNLTYGSNLTESQIISFIKGLNLVDFFKLFPEGLKTNVGKDGQNLSGGQKQLIAIIRAIIQNKKIILLDEPTNSLDVQTKNIIIQLIKKIKNKTILIVTHDQTILELFDDFIILK